jgi:antitoxin component YwqK of YwqJK toxin-antitoxin module
MLSEQKEQLEERKVWYRNGQLQSQKFYRDGKLEGEGKYWHKNGQLLERTFYCNGQREGENKYWYENGQLNFQGFYRKGKLEGESKFWHGNGPLWSRQFYRDGKLVDIDFCFSKKYSFLRLRKRFLNYAIFPNYTLLITDLAKLVYTD